MYRTCFVYNHKKGTETCVQWNLVIIKSLINDPCGCISKYRGGCFIKRAIYILHGILLELRGYVM